MAHFAELSEENVVVAVLVVSNDVLMVNGVEQEELGVDLLESLFGHRRWKQTSYNGRRRQRYAGIGYQYRADTDMFVPPCPGEGWTLDEVNGVWVEH